jgi:hypothetical protein
MGCAPVYADACGSTSKFFGVSTDGARAQSIPRTGGPEGCPITAEVDGLLVGAAVGPHPQMIANIAPSTTPTFIV